MYLLFDREKIVRFASVKKKHIICLKFVTYLLLDRKKNVRRKIIASVRKWKLNVIFDVAIECVIFDVEIERVTFVVEIERVVFDVEIERVRELNVIFDVAIKCVLFDVEIERVRFIICIILDFLIIIFSVIVFCIIIFFFWSIKFCDKIISSRRWFFFSYEDFLLRYRCLRRFFV